MSDLESVPVPSSPSESGPDPQAEVSIEVDGRVLTGVGVSEDTLREAIDAGSEPQPDAAASSTPQAEVPDERLSRGQRRFRALSAEVETAKAEAAREKSERERLAAEIEALKARSEPATAPARPEPRPEAPASPLPAAGLRPRPSVAEIGSTYADWDTYVADDNRWIDERFAAQEATIEARVQRALAQDREQAQVASRLKTIWEEGRTFAPDFDAIVNGSTVQFPASTIQAIYQDPDSPRLMYLLGKDRETAVRIAALTDPVQIGKAFAQVLSATPSGVSPASPGVARPSHAPPPVQPVGSGSRTTSRPLTELAETGDFEAYKARRHTEFKGGAHR